MKNQEPMTASGSSPGDHALSPLMIVGPVEEDGGHESYFHDFHWPIHRMQTCLEFAIEAHRRPPCMVVCERDLADGDWKTVLAVASCLAFSSPVIVTSRLADENLWAEVLNLGGYDVLVKPLDQREVSRVLNLAWERWANQALPTDTKLERCGKRDWPRCSAA